MTQLRSFVLLLAVTLGSASMARAEGPNSDRAAPAPNLYEQAFDLVLVRPFGLVPLVVAPVGCALGLPVAWVMRSPVDEADVCLKEPARYVFSRPLGEF